MMYASMYNYVYIYLQINLKYLAKVLKFLMTKFPSILYNT